MSCKNFDRDQTFTVHDFGPIGHVGALSVNLTHGLQPGGSFTAVVLTHQDMHLTFNDTKKNILLSFGVRFTQNELACNSAVDGIWGTELKAANNPWMKGVRVALTFIYDTDGYRIFVNGESVLFLKHRTTGRLTHVDISNAQVFKVVYQTTMDITP